MRDKEDKLDYLLRKAFLRGWRYDRYYFQTLSKLYIPSTIIYYSQSSCMTMELLAELQSSFRKEEDDYHH